MNVSNLKENSPYRGENERLAETTAGILVKYECSVGWTWLANCKTCTCKLEISRCLSAKNGQDRKIPALPVKLLFTLSLPVVPLQLAQEHKSNARKC